MTLYIRTLLGRASAGALQFELLFAVAVTKTPHPSPLLLLPYRRVADLAGWAFSRNIRLDFKWLPHMMDEYWV